MSLPGAETLPRSGGNAARPARSAARLWIVMGGVLLSWSIAEALLVYVVGPPPAVTLYTQACYGVGTAAVILFLSDTRRSRGPLTSPAWAAPAVLAGTFTLTVVLAQFAFHAFAYSIDGYDYGYLADTLLHGRLWNAPMPAPLHDVLETMQIAERAGKRISQYPPGWPVILALFKLVRLPQLADPVLGLLSATLLWLVLRQLPLSRPERLATLLLGTTAPFFLFNAASFFSHTATGVCLLAIILLELRDSSRPSAWNRAGIGFAFSVLLATRYEDFAIAFALFASDGLLRRRWRFLPWAIPAAIGAAPVSASLLLYNWRITGHPFLNTEIWASPWIGFGLHASGAEGRHSALRAVAHTVQWALEWQDFVLGATLPLYLAALWRRITARSLRWFDLLLPALAAFFFFYPDSGGFQYGPRYWYFGWVALPVTIAAGLASGDGTWRCGGARFEPLRLALAQLIAYAGFAAGFAVHCHLLARTWMLLMQTAAAAPVPALVLIPDMPLRYSAFQLQPSGLDSRALTRNGTGEALPPVALGNDPGPTRTARLCRQLPERHIFRLTGQGAPPAWRLEPAC